MPSNFNGNDESRIKLVRMDLSPAYKFFFQMQIIAAIGAVVILLYSLQYWTSGQLFRILGLGILVAGAALLSGFLLGFIFAIPRMGEGERERRVAVSHVKGDPTADTSTQNDSMPFNENLVQISDWLTKIIVGVGLVELHSIPGKLGELSYYLALGLHPAPCAESLIGGQAVGLAILIFYITLGFLLGYVWTAIDFRNCLRGKIKSLEESNLHKYQYIQTNKPLQLAEAFISANQLDEAMDTIDESLKTEPRNGRTVMTKARILKRQALKGEPADRGKLLKQAITCIDQAIALLPDMGEPVYNKACYQALLDPTGMKSDLLANLKLAFQLNPDLKQNAKEDDDLSALKQDDDFIKLIGNN
jgi:hypothetical protein